ncbi:hypothetical protein HYU14_01250 [Candidatus Woesearchaeota archaeon]|nr:hypothetical protein [Candidatus Woesearchaeota archaeon]
MQDQSEEVLKFLSSHGPSLPIEVAKAIRQDTILASAYLSQLISVGKVKISSVKVGTSPVYYLPGQESQLMKFSDNLNEKDKRAYERLKEKKILRDAELEPLMRVALRSIKDYALPLDVQFQGNTALFWKWYLLPEGEAKAGIGALLEPPQAAENLSAQKEKEVSKGAVNNPTDLNKDSTETTNNSTEAINTPKGETANEIPPAPPEVQRRLQEQKASGESIHREPIPREPLPEESIPKWPVRKKLAKKEKKEPSENNFAGAVEQFFGKNAVEVIGRHPIKKTETDFILKVPSAVGNLEYYCKARDKKSINDTDLASAFAQGQLRKLPVLLLTGGKLTKRALEMLSKDFKGMQVKILQ